MRDGNYLWFKFSWDNRQFLGKNEAFSIVPLNTTLPQSSVHVYNFCLVKCRERAAELQPVVKEIGLDYFESKKCLYKGVEHFLQFILSCDWMGIVTDIDLFYPNTTNLIRPICHGCEINKEYLRIGYLEAPFEYFESTTDISSFPTTFLPSVPILNRRYDCMHGVTNLLTNIVKLCLKEYLAAGGKRDDFNEPLDDCLDRRIHKSGFKEKSSFICKEMKAFFDHKLHPLLSHLFDHAPFNTPTPYPQPDGMPVLLTFSQALLLALDAVRYYRDFIYKPFPTPPEIQHLHVVRTKILSLHAGKKWFQQPTTHFMCNEAIYFIELDKSAYPTVQEGVEHHNYDNMVQSTLTLQSAEHSLSHQSNWQMLVDNQQLKLYVQQHNLAPPAHSLLPGEAQHSLTPDTPLTLTIPYPS